VTENGSQLRRGVEGSWVGILGGGREEEGVLDRIPWWDQSIVFGVAVGRITDILFGREVEGIPKLWISYKKKGPS